tara:strand:+ start:61 stop:408 length:348 start_codon:yes stop_codon:yes gene_type:complete
MAIPSGSGTEVLKVSFGNRTNSTETNILNGVANHIYTILSVVMTETSSSAPAINLYVKDDGGTSYFLVYLQALAHKKTFVFNDRLVLSGTDELWFKAEGTCDIDVAVSYIDQDWT